MEDTKNQINYFPIFSENIGRKILNNLGEEDYPEKISFYNILNGNNNSKSKTTLKTNKSTLKPEILEFEKLILLSFFFMNKNTKDLIPYGVFRNLLLGINKNYKLKAQNIKSVNTGLKHFISKNKLDPNEFKEFTKFLLEYNNTDIKKVNFGDLRKIFKEKYSNEKIFF